MLAALLVASPLLAQGVSLGLARPHSVVMWCQRT
jgi:hypothetical protein